MSRGFLDRWSERKRGREAEPEPEAEAPAPVAPEDARTDAELLAEAGLPDPDAAPEGTDFTAYLKAGLPERIRNRALRRHWRSNPVLANLDGLCDHDDDFRDAATVVPGMKTVYEVGKGILREALEVAEAPPGAVPQDAPTEPETPAAPEPLESRPAREVAEAPAQRPRHMRFRYGRTNASAETDMS